MMYAIRSLIRAAGGIGIAAVMFLVAVFGLAVLAEKSDTSIVKEKIAEAFASSEIQYPGNWDINDKRGIDTWADCLALDVSILYHEQLLMDAFDSRVYLPPVGAANVPLQVLVGRYNEMRYHTCDELFYVLSRPELATSTKEQSYFRYWWGCGVIARIALGMTGLSVGGYRQLIQILSFVALGTFVSAFFLSYGRAALVFLPLFLSILLGYGMLTFGQSIAHAPEFIVGLFMLSAYGLGNVQRRSRLARALWYSLLGSACAYFDLLNGNVLVIEILLCSQLTAPYVSRLMSGIDAETPEPTAILKEIIEGSAYIILGGFLAVVIRVVGYSFASHTSILDAFSAWLSAFTYRVSGTLDGLYPGKNVPPSLHRLFTALKGTRHMPFHGFLGIRLADVFYSLGFLSWATVLPLYLALRKKNVPCSGALLGFVSAACLVPVWFLLLEQHTIIHAYMTGRLMSLFFGLGMSLALLLGLLVLRKPYLLQARISLDMLSREV
jgi:hypothetical protein